MTFLRFVMLLAVGIWVGALVFFPFVAQTAFSALSSPHSAGIVVRYSLRDLHWLGFISGLTFIAASIALNRIATGRMRVFRLTHILVIAMLALTALSQFSIMPGMERLRASVGEISALPAGDPIRSQFDSLHAWSTRIEGAVLALGLIVPYGVSRRLAAER